jgi:hypothetical protein
VNWSIQGWPAKIRRWVTKVNTVDGWLLAKLNGSLLAVIAICVRIQTSLKNLEKGAKCKGMANEHLPDKNKLLRRKKFSAAA